MERAPSQDLALRTHQVVSAIFEAALGDHIPRLVGVEGYVGGYTHVVKVLPPQESCGGPVRVCELPLFTYLQKRSDPAYSGPGGYRWFHAIASPASLNPPVHPGTDLLGNSEARSEERRNVPMVDGTDQPVSGVGTAVGGPRHPDVGDSDPAGVVRLDGASKEVPKRCDLRPVEGHFDSGKTGDPVLRQLAPLHIRYQAVRSVGPVHDVAGVALDLSTSAIMVMTLLPVHDEFIVCWRRGPTGPTPWSPRSRLAL